MWVGYLSNGNSDLVVTLFGCDGSAMVFYCLQIGLGVDSCGVFVAR